MKMQRLFILCACLSLNTAHAFRWQDLWQNSDSQAQQMMNKKQYKEAQKTFKRSDWRAAAAFRAGDFQQASSLYLQSKQADNFYNAGNALAHLGQYKQAIEAYNKALKLDKTNKDAQHNRNIVEALLKKQPPSKNQDKQNQDKQNQDKQNQDKQNQDKQNQDKQNQDKQNQDKQNQDKQNQDKQNQDKQNQDKQNQDKQNQDKQNQDKQNQDKQNQDKQDKQDKQDQDKQDPAQKDQQEENQKNESKKSEQSKNNQEQQAKEQWLKMIPDDPGGLLREKFLRDYLRKRGE
ncbi:MAG: tetratricopeptide repeat protein [Legionellaceae bacterium]|nr:tetratricopeptide repeat protein [Legionellaceae bacterium]